MDGGMSWEGGRRGGGGGKYQFIRNSLAQVPSCVYRPSPTRLYIEELSWNRPMLFMSSGDKISPLSLLSRRLIIAGVVVTVEKLFVSVIESMKI